MALEQVRLIEELALNAWPTAVVQNVDGWRLRFNWGVTSRVNSVWPNELSGVLTLDERLALVEDFYARWGEAARYQICPAARPDNLDEILEQRGYQATKATSVQTVALTQALGPVTSHLPVTILDRLGDEWFNAYRQSENLNDHAARMRRGILERIGPRTGYASVQLDGQTVAIGLGVMERGWVGVFCMATRPNYRRRGAAASILRALAEWGQTGGATDMYLQVMENNGPARALYEGVGFQTLYGYHYRERRSSLHGAADSQRISG